MSNINHLFLTDVVEVILFVDRCVNFFSMNLDPFFMKKKYK